MKKITLALLLISSGFYQLTANAARLEACQTAECVEYFKQFARSSKHGHAQAMAILAEFYYAGYGTDKNETLALKYFKKAARQGVTSAYYKTGLIYLSNPEHKDLEQGVIYLDKAAHRGYKNSDFLLGVVYLSKSFGLYDRAQADKYLARAYEKKHRDMPEVIDIILDHEPIDEKTFPRLAAELSKTPLVTNTKQQLVWPEDDMEVITVTAPPLTEQLNQQLISFRLPVKSTGSRFPGNSCKQSIGCIHLDSMGHFSDIPDLSTQGFY